MRFVEGTIEDLAAAGIADASVDLIISNCVVCLALLLQQPSLLLLPLPPLPPPPSMLPSLRVAGSPLQMLVLSGLGA